MRAHTHRRSRRLLWRRRRHQRPTVVCSYNIILLIHGRILYIKAEWREKRHTCDPELKEKKNCLFGGYTYILGIRRCVRLHVFYTLYIFIARG